jgi:hypothetical protein
MKTRHYKVGAITEAEFGFDIIKDFECTYNDNDSTACPHAHSFQDEKHTCAGEPYTTRRWIVPNVVQAHASGGNVCTYVCLDCLIDRYTKRRRR